MTALPRSFFAGSALDVAPTLLGCVVKHAGVSLRLTEVEAYAGTADPGSHAFRGPTPRTRVMFGEPGHLYVYFTYGMHWCANLVCGPEGVASAVLLRAGEVVAGRDTVAERRPSAVPRDWARGPARLTTTLGIGKDHSGDDVCAPASRVSVEAPTQPLDPAQVRSGPRVGVSGPGGDGSDYPWRFWIDGEPTVSVYRPGVIRRRSR